MSDNEDLYEIHRDDTRYSTPVPELDDHRNQVVSVQRPPRSRRGTIDTLYGAATRDDSTADVSLWADDTLRRLNTVDREEAIEDGDARGPSPCDCRSRRPTATSIDSRGLSPPNSVKAFAQARRRERDGSVEATPLRSSDNRSLHRTISTADRRSLRSQRSRRFTNQSDAVSVLTSSTRSAAEDDVCFPQQTDPKRDKRKLYIDFDYLEKFIAEEERDHTPPKNQPLPRFFTAQNIVKGELEKEAVDIAASVSIDEKERDRILSEKFGEVAEHHDNNRFSFFSSAWESTIHAAEFGDLIMPGEDVRGLFSMPDGEEGVWWLNMSNPTEEEIRAICKAFGIHPLTMEDIEKQETREKIELFSSYYFACFRSFYTVESDGRVELEAFNIYVVVFREGTLSFSFAPNPHAASVRKRITSLKDYVDMSGDWICYALM
jgi:magnesium transporter